MLPVSYPKGNSRVQDCLLASFMRILEENGYLFWDTALNSILVSQQQIKTEMFNTGIVNADV